MATSTFDVRPDQEQSIYEFFRTKLLRELSQLFEWKGLPEEVPYDYLEMALTHSGRAMFFYDATYGYMTLACSADGVNVYGKPIRARAIRFTTDMGMPDYQRTIYHRYDEKMEKEKACVMIENMYGGEPMLNIVDFYAKRMAMLQQAFDTNALWQNLPPIFTTPNDNMKLSIMKLFSDIRSGKPWIIVDKEMLAVNGVPVEFIEVQNKLADIYDAMNEIYNSFKETVGINSPGADKKERLLLDEVNANNQSIQTCLHIMQTCREVACEEINEVFGLNISVQARGADEAEGDVEDGTGDDGAEDGSFDGEL
ncbi:MAG: hypothetical protein EOM07_11235 [Clostridia bacterium]|nr:hypothetical protein [Clostridia bacterium]